LFLCNVGENSVMDTIPLAEIDKIAGSKHSSPLAGNGKNNVFSRLLNCPRFKSIQRANTLQSPSEKISAENTNFFIRTRVEGANAGRTYSLRVCSHTCPDIIVALRRISKLARMAAEPRSRYEILQENVRRKIDSQQFQFFAAVLIFLVGSLHFLLSINVRI
jgi:hypothetical protein